MVVLPELARSGSAIYTKRSCSYTEYTKSSFRNRQEGMSPRPRKASDDQVYAAAYRAMNRAGPRRADPGPHRGGGRGDGRARWCSASAPSASCCWRSHTLAADGTAGLFAGLRRGASFPAGPALRLRRLHGPARAHARGLRPQPLLAAGGPHRPRLQAERAGPTRSTERGIRKLLDEAIKAGELKPSPGRKVSTRGARPHGGRGHRRVAHELGIPRGGHGGGLDPAGPWRGARSVDGREIGGRSGQYGYWSWPEWVPR